MSHGKAIHVMLITGITAMNQTAALGPVLSEHPVCGGGGGGRGGEGLCTIEQEPVIALVSSHCKQEPEEPQTGDLQAERL